MRLLRTSLAAAVLVFATPAYAEVSEPAERPDEQFDFMNLLTHWGQHDLKDEGWNAYGQFTLISSEKLPFHAKYTNLNGSPNSLSTSAENSWTGAFTLYLGARLWHGGEAYFVPETVAEQPLSGLKGLGGAIQNFELQKNGSTIPQVYRAKAYFQQTIDLGGDRVVLDSDPGQLGTKVDSRRLVLRAGNFSVIDFFDKNSFGDLTQTFFNMAFLTYAAYDFVADARGYTFGGMAGAFYDDWSIRFGRFAPPTRPNTQPLTFRFDQFYGDQVELEHDHRAFGEAGAVRVLAYRNVEDMGRFDDAVAAYKANPLTNNAAVATTACPGAYGSSNSGAPDLCWVRKTNTKVGIGISLEQHFTDDFGAFFRGMWSDGQTEVYSFTSTDRSAALGVTAKGTRWRRPRDLAGVGAGLGWISQAHANYLRMGGIDGFIGDGTITQAMESVVEAFYSFNVLSSVWLSADYQHITNPAFNADRGPVDIFGGRLHAEF
jgi:high affinity Mn2+ porin